MRVSGFKILTTGRQNHEKYYSLQSIVVVKEKPLTQISKISSVHWAPCGNQSIWIRSKWPLHFGFLGSRGQILGKRYKGKTATKTLNCPKFRVMDLRDLFTFHVADFEKSPHTCKHNKYVRIRLEAPPLRGAYEQAVAAGKAE